MLFPTLCEALHKVGYVKSNIMQSPIDEVSVGRKKQRKDFA
jgi:hypothetical protein